MHNYKDLHIPNILSESFKNPSKSNYYKSGLFCDSWCLNWNLFLTLQWHIKAFCLDGENVPHMAHKFENLVSSWWHCLGIAVEPLREWSLAGGSGSLGWALKVKDLGYPLSVWTVSWSAKIKQAMPQAPVTMDKPHPPCLLNHNGWYLFQLWEKKKSFSSSVVSFRNFVTAMKKVTNTGS